ncbi:MAG TPA: tetratricopeptide repeat protein [Pyrinomonadaceae bacterium]|jgi:tetratricopeptide (TPR) repeat protein|nr:tetratricopeptide repeat protein [Pyrinomonadaceae bacterium]
MSTEATNREAAVALAEELGNLPLALEQAAAYTALTGVSLADYLSLFRERAAAYTPPASPSADYPAALAVTFELAFTHLSEESPAAADLLTICAFLAPDDVPLEIFKDAAAKEGDEAVSLPESLATAAANPEALAAAAAMLQTYALAKVRGGSFLSTHRLIQAIARDRLGGDERKTWAEATATVMRAAFPFNKLDPRTWPLSARLLQHALTTADHAGVLGVADVPVMFLLFLAGEQLFNNAKLAEAKAVFERSAELCEKLLGPADTVLAALLNNIGMTLHRQGNFDEAANYLKRALAIDEEVRGSDHPYVAIRLNNIGEILRERGAYAEARSHYERALAIAEAAHSAPNALIPTILNNIGLALREQDDAEGACAYYERAILIDEEAYGSDHPNIAVRLNNLGAALLSLGDLDTARQHFERALRIFKAHFGEEHPWTLTAKRYLKELDEHAAVSPRRRKKPRKRRK